MCGRVDLVHDGTFDALRCSAKTGKRRNAHAQNTNGLGGLPGAGNVDGLSAQAQDAKANGDGSAAANRNGTATSSVASSYNTTNRELPAQLPARQREPYAGGRRETTARDVQVGDVYDASIGMGLALNDRALISFGYDQSFVGATRAD